MLPIPVVNIASSAFKANPFPFYARLRSEAPVYRTILPDKQSAWLITRYDDVFAVLKDERFGKDRVKATTPEQNSKQPWIPNHVQAAHAKHARSRCAGSHAAPRTRAEGFHATSDREYAQPGTGA
jgi:cytochrome P450